MNPEALQDIKECKLELNQEMLKKKCLQAKL